MTVTRLAVVALAVMGIAATTLDFLPGLLAQPTVSHAAADGIYTTAQAQRGDVLYGEQCVKCHGEIKQLTPDMAALLADHTFRARWKGRALGELFKMIQVEMPQEAPGSLSDQQTADLVAFILSGNRRPAGDVPLPDNLEMLMQIPFNSDR